MLRPKGRPRNKELENPVLIEFFQERSLTCSFETLLKFRHALGKFDQYLKDHMTSEGFTRKLAVNFILDTKAAGYADSYCECFETRLRVFYTWLYETGIHPSLVFGGKKMIQWRASLRPETFPFTQAEYEKVRDYLKEKTRGTNENHWYGMMIVGWNTGMRLYDCGHLHWSMINLDRKSIQMTPHKTKRHGKTIEIPLARELHKYLLDLPFKSGPVFPEFVEKWKTQNKSLSHRFTILCGWGGVRGKSFHALRHAMASRLLNNNVPISVVSEITGQTMETLQRYSHVQFSEKAEAMRSIEA